MHSCIEVHLVLNVKEESQVERHRALWHYNKGLFILEFMDLKSCKSPTLLRVVKPASPEVTGCMKGSGLYLTKGNGEITPAYYYYYCDFYM